jgi:hypothetical protein
MHDVIEKISRKAAELLYRVGMLQPFSSLSEQSQDSGIPETKFVFRFYPYHLIQADQIRRDFIFDSDGVPMRFHRDTRDYRSPLYPAYWGLIHTNVYESGIAPEQARQVIVQMSDYLIGHGRNAGNMLFFDFTVDHLRLDLKAPWVSALTQALAASLFLRTYQMTSNPQYRLAALQSARVLTMPQGIGGVLETIQGQYPWLEEYPSTSTHVLNGCLFGLIALEECAQEEESEFRSIADQISSSVIALYPRYRVRQYLLYDLLRKHFCNPHYMGLHALLFLHLWHNSGRETFLKIALELGQKTDWRLYLKSVHRPDSGEVQAWIHTEFRQRV